MRTEDRHMTKITDFFPTYFGEKTPKNPLLSVDVSKAGGIRTFVKSYTFFVAAHQK
jgi:hypothetical protein